MCLHHIISFSPEPTHNAPTCKAAASGKSFIEGMGARIWAESEGAGKGSRFVVEFVGV
jgi:hypothetical protein